MKHISAETGCRIQVKGRGSGYVEQDGKEADADMFLHLTAAFPEQIDKGRKLCEDLVRTVRAEYDRFMEMKKSYKPEMFAGGLFSGGMPPVPPGMPGMPGMSMPPGPPMMPGPPGMMPPAPPGIPRPPYPYK